jgi:hypothetical protein
MAGWNVVDGRNMVARSRRGLHDNLLLTDETLDVFLAHLIALDAQGMVGAGRHHVGPDRSGFTWMRAQGHYEPGPDCETIT